MKQAHSNMLLKPMRWSFTAVRYGIRVKYHKAVSIEQYGAPFLQLAWTYTQNEPGEDAHIHRQVSKHVSHCFIGSIENCSVLIVSVLHVWPLAACI